MDLEVTGTIPVWACGVLFRTGVGSRHIKTDNGGTFTVAHWFDHLAVVHRFQILPAGDGSDQVRVVYNSRSTCDALIARIRKTGQLNTMTFAAKYDPCKSLFSKCVSVFRTAANSERGSHDPSGRTMAVTMSVNYPGLPKSDGSPMKNGKGTVHTLCNKTDTSAFQMLDPETLEPVGLTSQLTLHPELVGQLSATHGRACPITGDIFNYNLALGRTTTYRIFTVSAATGKTSILATFSDTPAYIHSLFLTEKFMVLCIWNSKFYRDGLQSLWEQNIAETLRFDSDRPATWYVIDRRPPADGGHGVVAIYETDPFFAFHTINAYEDVSTVDGSLDLVCDVSTFRNTDIITAFYLDSLMSSKTENPGAGMFGHGDHSCTPAMARFRLKNVPLGPVAPHGRPPRFKAERDWTTPHIFPNRSLSPELPTINPLYNTKKHRYVYGVTATGLSVFLDGLAKHDVETHEVKTWIEHGQSAGEAIFVPNPNGNADEDDGVLLSVVLDGLKSRSYLLVLDAKTMKEIGRATFTGKRDDVCEDGEGKVIGLGFHGAFVPNGGRSVDA